MVLMRKGKINLVQSTTYIYQKENNWCMRILKILCWNLHWVVHRLKRSECFIKNSNLWEFTGWWNDVKISEADQGIEVISIKEAAEGILDELKENKVYMLVFFKIESCQVGAGNMDKCSILRAWSKKLFPLLKEGMGHTLTRWNQNNMSSYEIWGGWEKLEEL